MSSLRSMLAIVLAGLAVPSAALAQERGAITGQVTDQTTGEPLQAAQVFLAGTQIGVLTGRDGGYRIPNLRPGDYDVRVSLIGYRAGAMTVSVGAGLTATADFSLAPSAVALEGIVVTTARGEGQRRRELGNTVGIIEPTDIELSVVSTFADLVQARSPGVAVLPSGGTTGTGARIRIRGSNSISLSNEPLLIVDGIRVNNSPGSFSIGLGGQSISRMNDINPEDIASIEILKGPSAAAQYGTAAANGVIQITTRRGQVGAPQWRFWVENGLLQDRHVYPANFSAAGTGPLGGFCILTFVSLGLCEQTELRTFNPLMDPRSRPFRDGRRQTYGLSVGGGGAAVTYFVSGEFDREDGVLPINRQDAINLRANVRAQLRDNLELTVNAGGLFSDAELPPNDNNLFGILSGGLLGGSQFNENSEGFILFRPEVLFTRRPFQDTRRTMASGNAAWRPLDWLSVTGVGGVDYISRHDHMTLQPEVFPFGDNIEGFRTSNRFDITTVSANLNATATYPLARWVQGTSSAGGQFIREVFRGTNAFGAGLLAGTGALDGTATRFAVGETNTEIVTLGGFVQQQLAFDDRLFLTGALRFDDNSTFGSRFDAVTQPSLSASWVVNEYDWFPELRWLNTVRLRGAWGRSSLRPGFRDAIRFLSPLAVRADGIEQPAFTIGGVGRADLRPETAREFELGVDLGVLDDRVGLELTRYDKKSRDALVSRRLAPSAGVTATRFENLGALENKGWEGLLRAVVVERPRLNWEVNLNGSWNRNTLLELGEGIEPIIFGLGGDTQRHIEGYPAGGYWQRPILGFEDRNGDGIITPDEIEVGDEPVFLGDAFPKRTFSISSTATVFRFLRLYALLDHAGGHKLFNSTEEFRCGAFFNCQAMWDPNSSLEDQARAVASSGALMGERVTAAGFIEDASFWKLREVAFTLLAPRDWARSVGGQSLSLTVSGRNLRTWTDFTGLDPEINFAGQSNFLTAEFLSQPPIRRWTARLDVTF